MFNTKLSYLKKYKEYGVTFIRLMTAFHLVYGIHVYIFNYSRMENFVDFLNKQGVPLPLFAAFLSAYSQLICGTLFFIRSGNSFCGNSDDYEFHLGNHNRAYRRYISEYFSRDSDAFGGMFFSDPRRWKVIR